ncbi:MAG TPA: carbon storage regulator [Candidatus Solibacter sp.]|jgi:carbon storage regulator
MLVMSRRQGETILIGDQIEIVIAHIGRSRVKVGIRAPRETTIVAREVKLVRDENLAAAAAGRSMGEISRLFQNILTAPRVPTVPADETVTGPHTS